MPTFGYAAFAVAGAIAATAPLVIHLLNRRRFRVMRWAAMDFLLNATKRSRRILNLRDILLLLLRTACVLLFAFALARPYFTSTSNDFDPTEPVHAVLIVDNSLSMGFFESNSQSLLEIAKEKGRTFIERLPENSRISVIPLFGTPTGYSRDAFRTPETAVEQLDNIEIVDQGVTGAGGITQLVREEALRAQERVPEMSPATRVVFLGDQQKVNWANWTHDASDTKSGLPDIQVVDVSPAEGANTWVADFQPQDVVAVAGATTTFTATIRHEGPEGSEPRRNVEVVFSVDGQEGVARQHLDALEPGAAVPIVFRHRVERELEGDATSYLAAKVEISAPEDQLPEDNSRHVVVPLVQSVPVLFVDQFGSDEDPTRDKYGETRRIRLLMETNLSDVESDSSLVDVKQATIEEISEPLLEDKRLVVIAGVEKPTAEAIKVLEEYVRQGGQVIIAAGAEFDPTEWNAVAWTNGHGILPAPLESQPLGRSLDEPTNEPLVPFQIDFSSLRHDYFVLPGVERDTLKKLYTEALFFFKAIAINESDELRASLAATNADWQVERLKFLAASEDRQRNWNDLDRQGQLTAEQIAEREADDARRADYQPEWLLWSGKDLDEERPGADEEESLRRTAEEIAKRELPRTLARFSNGKPFMVERRIGRGRVLFVASGVSSSGWNTIRRTNAIVMFDRIMRAMVGQTLPPRNFETVKPIELPVAAKDRDAQFVLTAPGAEPKLIDGESLRADVFGVSIKDVTRRGIYRITAIEPDADITDDVNAPGVRWQIPLAVARPERIDDEHSESELTPITEKDFQERAGDESHFAWVARYDEISLEGGQVRGQDLWWWLIAAVLVALLVEWLIIAWPQLSRENNS